MKTTKSYGYIRLSFVITVFMLLSVFATMSYLSAGDKKLDDKKTKSGSSHFLIITTHTPEQCLKSLDEFSAKSADLLKKIDWGCKAGVHSGYVVVKATDETAARYMLPYGERKTARIIQVDKFTLQEIKELHEKM